MEFEEWSTQSNGWGKLKKRELGLSNVEQYIFAKETS